MTRPSSPQFARNICILGTIFVAATYFITNNKMPRFNLSKFKNKNFLSLMGNGVISLFGLVLFGILYRSFSEDDMGTWIVFMVTQSVLDSIRNGFLGTATVKFYAGTGAERAADVLGSIWFLAIAVTGIMLAANAGALLLLPFIHNFQAVISIKWVGITMLSSLPFSVMFWKLQADERYGTMLWMRMLNSGSTILAFLVLIFMNEFTLERALLWNLITKCLTSVIGLLANLGGVRKIVARSRTTILEILHFGKYSMASGLSSNLLGSVNTYIVTFMLGPGAVAILSVPSKLMELVEIPLRSFASTGMSSMAVALNQNDQGRVSYILNKYAGMLTLVFIPMAIAVFFLADIPVNILSSGKYSGTEAANLYRIVMLIAILYPIDRFNGVALDIIHQPRINFLKVQIMLLVKIVGTVACIALMHNVYGAPLGGLLSMIAGLAYGSFHLNKFLDFKIPKILRTGFFELKALSRKQGS